MGYAACNWNITLRQTRDCSAIWSAWATLHPRPGSVPPMTGNAISFISMLHTAKYAVVASDDMTRIVSAALTEDWHICS